MAELWPEKKKFENPLPNSLNMIMLENAYINLYVQ